MTGLLAVADVLVHAAMAAVLVGAVLFCGVLLVDHVRQIRGER